MRRLGIIAMAWALALGALAQGPPKNAVDITSLPATTPSAANSAAMAAAPVSNVIRIYVDTLSGSDASAVQGLLTQALFESKKVVITENQANANLIIKGSVLRQQPPAAAPAPATSSRTRKRRVPARTPGGTTDATVIADLTGHGSVPLTDLDAPGAGFSLPGLSLDTITDLSHFEYRLNLRLLSPDGDLVWMSGQGPQAPPFASASAAVQATVAPLLAAVATHPAAGAAGGPGGAPLP